MSLSKQGNITTKNSSEPLHFEIVPRIRRLPTLLLGDGLLAVAPVRVDIGRLLCAGPGIKCINASLVFKLKIFNCTIFTSGREFLFSS